MQSNEIQNQDLIEMGNKDLLINKLQNDFFAADNHSFDQQKFINEFLCHSKIEFFEPHKIGRRQKRVNVRELFQGAFQRNQQHGTQIACVFYVFAALMALFDYLSWLLLLWLFYVFGYYINAFIKECNACFRNNNNQIHSIELAQNGPAAAGANEQ
ncbi:hypothetical protein niasHS_007089 [Heterodera schachtii]|uniref:Uncharacterized protein n=1 Tax=Heterodera schachtii TaxID=97005 RepID=A0ABD2JFK9_HETSC